MRNTIVRYSKRPPIVNQSELPTLPKDFEFKRYSITGSGLGREEDLIFENILTAFARKGNWEPLPVPFLMKIVSEDGLQEQELLPNLISFLIKFAYLGIVDLVETEENDYVVAKPKIREIIERCSVIRINVPYRRSLKKKKNWFERLIDWME